MLAGCFLLHIFHFIASLFSTKPSAKRHSVSQHANAHEGEDYYDDAQDELDAEYDGSLHHHDECYEDCDDEGGFLDEQRFSAFEDSRLFSKGGSEALISSRRSGDEGWEATATPAAHQLNETSRLSSSGEASERFVTPNHHESSTMGGSQKEKTLMISQPSLYTSADRPPNFDDVVPAANATVGQASIRPRTLPPTLSDIRRTLQESSDLQKQIAAPAEGAGLPPNPAARTTSFDNFMAKFQKHFQLDS